LPVAIGELVEDVPPCRVGQRLEDITHEPMIGKWLLACQFPSRPVDNYPIKVHSPNCVSCA
jgi:hypothetical protein